MRKTFFLLLFVFPIFAEDFYYRGIKLRHPESVIIQKVQEGVDPNLKFVKKKENLSIFEIGDAGVMEIESKNDSIVKIHSVIRIGPDSKHKNCKEIYNFMILGLKEDYGFPSVIYTRRQYWKNENGDIFLFSQAQSEGICPTMYLLLTKSKAAELLKQDEEIDSEFLFCDSGKRTSKGPHYENCTWKEARRLLLK